MDSYSAALWIAMENVGHSVDGAGQIYEGSQE